MTRGAFAAVLASALVGCGSSTPDGVDGAIGGSDAGDAPSTVDAGMPTTLATSTLPYGIAVDRTHVYWTDPGDQTVLKVPLEGGTPVVLASNQANVNAIAVSANTTLKPSARSCTRTVSDSLARNASEPRPAK